ncbi:MAG TPA: HAD-IIIC family phosphatase [Opitutaceae bacterium]|jgi:FkbH-like protein
MPTKNSVRSEPVGSAPPQCALCGNFALELIREPLAFWIKRLGLNLGLAFAEFDQVFQFLLAASGLSDPQFAVVLVQLERWLELSAADPFSSLPERCRALSAAVTGAAASKSTRHLVVFCPPSPPYRGHPRLAEIEESFAAPPGIEVCLSREFSLVLSSAGYDANFDPYTASLAAVPYSRIGHAWIATIVARRLRRYLAPPRKVIVADCDDTLWDGCCAESEPEMLTVSANRRAVQQFLLQRRQSGQVLCLCSKNDPEDVLAVFDRHHQMLLRREHVAALRINWQPKPANLASLSDELGVSLDSFIYLDNDPIECAAMRHAYPGVVTVHLPADEGDMGAFLARIWEFDLLPATAEDARRSEYYRAENLRSNIRRETPTLEGYLEMLQIKVAVRPFKPLDLNRATQLMQRTNRFNLNGAFRSAAELTSAASRPHACCEMVHACDRFGDYGDIGLMMGRFESQHLVIDTLVLSCRVLGRGVETYLLKYLVERARQTGKSGLCVRFVDTSRNHPVAVFLQESGFRCENEEWHLLIPS